MGLTIDGNDISGVTIDGQEVQEVTIDGAKVWETLRLTNFNTEGWRVVHSDDIGTGTITDSYIYLGLDARPSDDKYDMNTGYITQLPPEGGAYELKHDMSPFNYLEVDWEGYGDSVSERFAFGVYDYSGLSHFAPDPTEPMTLSVLRTNSFTRRKDVLDISSVTTSKPIILGATNRDKGNGSTTKIKIYGIRFYT